MNTASTLQVRYTAVAIWLHWSIALLILTNLPLGFLIEASSKAQRQALVPLHISIGITVLALTAARLLWRLAHRPPPFAAGTTRWERLLAHMVHGLLYLMMLGMPLTGWAILSAHPPRPGVGPMIWGLLRLPAIGPIAHMEAGAQKGAHDAFAQMHWLGGWIMVALLALHVAAALKHQFHDRQPSLSRIGLGGPH